MDEAVDDDALPDAVPALTSAVETEALVVPTLETLVRVKDAEVVVEDVVSEL